MIYTLVKRVVDLAGALLGLLIALPLLLLIASAIKLTSDGPVFVKESSRVGKDRRVFRMYKFRTMIKDAHLLIRQDPKFKKLYAEYRNNNFKLSNDPRVTSLGYWLRKTSLDEFPQLINVIKGEMSLVGPRAYYPDELAEQTRKFPKLENFIDQALKTKPGITGVWQVSGRSRIGFEARIKLDADYSAKKSLIYDLLILIKTPFAVFRGEGIS